MTSIQDRFETYQPDGEAEAADVARVRALLERSPDPYPRTLPLHVTGSALIVHPDSGRVLLRWHPRQQAWIQVGGHGDPGENDPLGIARREAAEETGLADLAPWPDPQLRHVVIVSVPAAGADPAHEHADARFFLATRMPDTVVPEAPDAPLRWLTLAEARDLITEPNLRETLNRAERLLPDRP